MNHYLKLAKSQLYQSYQELKGTGKLLTAQMVKDYFTGDDKRTKTLLELIEYHSKKIEDYIRKFLKSIKLKNIHLSRLNYKFICDFESFMYRSYPKDRFRAMAHNTAMKHIQRLRKMIRLAYCLEWLVKDLFDVGK
ncbi:phage integrase SAM-like domain-containing protein [Maribacter sp. X9]|uniref:phage integrase SAM-like domain-containing protein n=1 Tax=Maribacter sp. X9 TaxID=3402159 RepID=UPI003AF34A9E